MKNLLLTICIIIAVIFSAQAQIHVQIKAGNESLAVSNNFLYRILGEDQDGLYALSKNSGIDIQMIRYDQSYVKVAQKGIIIDEGADGDFEEMILSNGKLYLFTSNRSKNIRTLTVQTVDKVKMTPNKDKIEIENVESRFAAAGEFEFRTSRNGNKLLIFSDSPFKAGKADKFSFSVYDADIKKIWSREVEMPYGDRVFLPGLAQVEDNGDVFLIGAYFEEKAQELHNNQDPSTYFGNSLNLITRHAQNRKLKYTYGVIRISANSIQEYRIEFPNACIRDIQAITDGESLICTGFYSPAPRLNVSGCFYNSFSLETGEIKIKSLDEFKPEFLSSGMTTEEASDYKLSIDKKEKEFLIDVRDVVLRDDKSIVMIANQYVNDLNWNEHIGETALVSRFKEGEFYKDIVMVSYDSEGKVEWIIKIPKKPKIVGNQAEIYNSYALAITKDYQYFFLNDNISNKKLPADKPSFYDPHRPSALTLVRVDRSGKVEK
ncbi:MAG: hypothetical protein K2X86_07740, partial [Cytophagaceae bacterium]|nr:hypothetical protein [Cytophagaceae bacterium]